MVERLVVFALKRPRALETKQALALRSKGWVSIILYLDQPNYELSHYFDEAIRYQDPILALMNARDFPQLFITFIHSYLWLQQNLLYEKQAEQDSF